MPAIFLDRDGVLNENRPDHVKSWAEFSFLPGAIQALRRLAQLHIPIFVVTNQAAISRQLTTRTNVEQIHRRMLAQIRRAGAEITDVFYCPHDSSQGCGCRKPAPGLLLDAATRFDVDLNRSVLVGDACTDILAGQRVGCKTVLVLTGRGHQSLQALGAAKMLPPTAVASDLLDAVPIIARLLRPSLASASFAAPIEPGTYQLQPLAD